MYRLTVRHGSSVKRETFDELTAAVAAMEARVDEVLRAGPLAGVKMLRDFEPGDRVAARVELSTGGWLRGRDAGVDVMGDGTLIPYAGGIRRRELEPLPGESPLEAVGREIASGR